MLYTNESKKSVTDSHMPTKKYIPEGSRSKKARVAVINTKTEERKIFQQANIKKNVIRLEEGGEKCYEIIE